MKYNLDYRAEFTEQIKRKASRFRIILASNSPRRAEIMNRLGIEFIKLVPDVDENIAHNGHPFSFAEILARLKAEAVTSGIRGLVVAADTIVVLDGKIINKPADDADAKGMLEMLSGQEHEVITAVALRDLESGRIVQGHSVSSVRFKPLSRSTIEEYIASGEPFGKAGAYAIQGMGGQLVDEYQGELDNIIGFPAGLFDDLLDEIQSEV
jgi:septum formation protein